MMLLFVAVVMSALAGPWRPPISAGADFPVPTISSSPSPVPSETSLALLDELTRQKSLRPWDLTWLVPVVIALFFAAIISLVVLWIRRHPAPRVPEGPDDAGIGQGDACAGPEVALPYLPTLRAGIMEADEELRTAARPADAVIAAWVQLEAAAERSGVPRDPASTPTEFTVVVLDRTPVDPATTRILLRLYLRARFSGEPMAPADVGAASDALGILAAGLGERDSSQDVPGGADDSSP